MPTAHVSKSIVHIGTCAFARSQLAYARHGRYTLETGTPSGKRRYKSITSIREVIPKSNDSETLIEAGARPDTRIVSFTVTEAGYCFDAGHRLDTADPGLQADLAGNRKTIRRRLRHHRKTAQNERGPGNTLKLR